MLIGLTLLGIVGALLAVPLAAAIQVLLVQVLVPAIRRSSGQSAQIAQSSPAVAEFNVNQSDEMDLKPHNERDTYLQVGPLLLTVNNTDLGALAARINVYLDRRQQNAGQ